MTSSGNRRRPRSGAPERPDLKDKAEKIHAEVFGNQNEPSPRGRSGNWLVRILAGYGAAAVFWVLSAVLNNEYLMLFALSLAAGMVLMTFVRLYTLWRK